MPSAVESVVRDALALGANASEATAIADLQRRSSTSRVMEVGDYARDFTLQDLQHRRVSLADMRSRGPVILVFFRGLWCPHCNADLLALRNTLPAIRELGASVVAISPQTPESSRQAAADLKLGFPILYDEGGSVSAAYGLRFEARSGLEAVHASEGVDLAEAIGRDGTALPIPAHYIVERSGEVSYVRVNLDYRRRGDPDHLVSHLLRPPREAG